MAYTVYELVFPDGKRYIGLTRQNVKARWHGGSGYRNQKRLYAAIQHYGWENIQHNIIRDNLSEEQGKSLEEELIKKFNTQNHANGYNTKNGGQMFGEHDEEFIENARKRMIGNKYCVGRKISKEHINALVQGRSKVGYKPWNKGVAHSDDAKRAMSAKAKERWKNDEYREKIAKSRPDMHGENNPMFGKKHSDETKALISKANSGRKWSAETREKLKNRGTKKVVQISLDGTELNIFNSITEAARKVGGNSTNITSVCKGKGATYKGFRWKYADN